MGCDSCPRYCDVDRRAGETGFCRTKALPLVALCDLHLWEEPPISGSRGSGAVFFGRCNLRCVFCQNHDISQGDFAGVEMDAARLADAFLELQGRGAHNINLVSPTHFSEEIARAMRVAREHGLSVPFVYNSNGYDSQETLARMAGLVDVYLPDLKYVSEDLSARYSSARDYFRHASKAILEMSKQVGVPRFAPQGTIERGLIVRHLVLPGCAEDSIQVLRWIKDNLPRGTYLSLMSQYHPCHRAAEFPEVNRGITEDEYARVVDELERLGLEDGFIQDLTSSTPDYTPDFSRRSPQ